MKLSRLFVLIAVAALFMVSCDDTTDNIGHSVTNRIDGLSISDSTFNVTTESMGNYSILSNSRQGIVGMMKDPETNTYVTADYMAQFSSMPNFALDTLEYIKAANDGLVTADSCYILINYQTTYGDTLAPMNVTAYEMSKPMEEGAKYYTDFDPIANGYVDTENAYKVNTTYSLKKKYFKIYLNDKYTAKDGTVYNNYGEYIMHTRMNHPEYFKNNYQFVHNVCPGFYIKHESGVGNMAYISQSQLDVYFSHIEDDSLYHSAAVFWGTEEVLQTSTITNDRKTMEKLASDETCTYLKTPAGIFTELTLPVEKIMKDHENDTITSAKLVLQRLNNKTTSDYAFSVPSQILMIPKDSLHSFFENNDIYNNKNSFVTSWAYNAAKGSFDNSYTFNNISGMISAMYNCDRKSTEWNKVVLVPVKVSTTTTSSGSTTVVKVTNDMSLTSTRLVKGTDSDDSPIKINIIYSRFK